MTQSVQANQLPKVQLAQENGVCQVVIDDRTIAQISLNEDTFATQPWVVTINGEEVHRANTFAKCQNWVTWHHKNGTLPEVEASAIANEQTEEQVSSAPIVSGSLTFKPSKSADPTKTVYEVFCGEESFGIIINDGTTWYNSKNSDRYASPHQAASALFEFTPTDEVIEPVTELINSIKVDSDFDLDFGFIYRTWYKDHLIGTFYRAFDDDKWVAQPVATDFRPRLDTLEQAQLVIISNYLTPNLAAA